MAEEAQAEEQKEKCPECPVGAPAWMVTYSDLVTLLLTFFVLLLSMASMDPVRFTEASSSLKDAFGMHNEPAHVEFAIPVLPSPPITQFSPIQQQTTKKVYDKIKSQIDSRRLNNNVGVIQNDDESIILRISDSVMFERGQAKISPKAYSILRTIADIIRPLPMDLRIEGHTDDIPVSSSNYGNWDLSVDRSVAVMRFFTQGDLLPLDRMAAAGYGQDRPIVPNRDEISRSKNRRVDFFLKLQSNVSKTKLASPENALPL
ncbi:flagellar motor protein MotB [Desulforhopalus sp. IMCC35007]|uniref:OmpA/MotB family protein n=1 Tax=Desulforhopalus sp. IMCC35007 TaxID=2569543 RepID=UPI0010AEE938|nr:flagellar motor protein MotB [Desulforhopalus sp. IMCC35007]TKB10286.1 flagellar motor protein MotB [Desulforhopalus sp. IMCC35007]